MKAPARVACSLYYISFLDADELVSNDVDSRETGSGSRVDFRRFAKETGEIRSGSRVDFRCFAKKTGGIRSGSRVDFRRFAKRPKLLASSAT